MPRKKMRLILQRNFAMAKKLCTRCAHREVCTHKQDYLDILKAVENATVTRDTADGKITSKKVIHYDFISGISVGCKYHQNWTETYRSGEAIL